jgi:hypothetical protein
VRAVTSVSVAVSTCAESLTALLLLTCKLNVAIICIECICTSVNELIYRDVFLFHCSAFFPLPDCVISNSMVIRHVSVAYMIKLITIMQSWEVLL